MLLTVLNLTENALACVENANQIDSLYKKTVCYTVAVIRRQGSRSGGERLLGLTASRGNLDVSLKVHVQTWTY